MVVLVLVVGWEQLRLMEICGVVGGPVAYVTSCSRAVLIV